MKKMKKALAVLSAAIMTTSMSIFNVSADETNKKVAWSCKNSFDVLGEDEAMIVCYEDGSTDSYWIQFDMDVVFTFPEGVEPTLEYVGNDSIEEISQYRKRYNYFEYAGHVDTYTVAEGENKYVFSLGIETNNNRDETVAIKTEIAKQLLAEGKIVSAEVTKYVVIKPDCINCITIKLDDETKTIIEEDISNISALYKVPYTLKSSQWAGDYVDYLLEDGGTQINYEGLEVPNSGINDKDTLLNLPEICKVLKESNPNIAEVGICTTYPLPSADSSEQGILASPIYMQGDANRNNKIDLQDAVSIAKYLLKPESLDEETIELADINNDGTTDIQDAVTIARKLLNK